MMDLLHNLDEDVEMEEEVEVGGALQLMTNPATCRHQNHYKLIG